MAPVTYIGTVFVIMTDFGEVILTDETVALQVKLDPLFKFRLVPPRKGSKARASWDLIERAAIALAREAYDNCKPIPAL